MNDFKNIKTFQLFGGEIKQQIDTELFCSTDLVKLANDYLMQERKPLFNFNNWINSKGTKEFIEMLEVKFGKVYIPGQGRGIHSWVHPYLFIDLALAIDPKLKIEVYGWLYDYLLRYRNESGDSYRKMAGALFDNMPNKKEFQVNMVKMAKLIQDEVKCTDWQKATQQQLEYRDKIQEYIALFCEVFNKNNREAIRQGFLAAKKWYNEKYPIL